jgi:hypothetical protein
MISFWLVVNKVAGLYPLMLELLNPDVPMGTERHTVFDFHEAGLICAIGYVDLLDSAAIIFAYNFIHGIFPWLVVEK